MPNHFYGPRRGGKGLFKTDEGSDENNLANTIGEREEREWDWGQISIHHLQEGTRKKSSPNSPPISTKHSIKVVQSKG